MPETTSSGKYGVQLLDYQKARIEMQIDTEMEASFRINACYKEPWTIEFIEQQPPNSWFIDVGANVGPYTLVAAASGLRVVAVEPHMASAHKLWMNLKLNMLSDHVLIWAGGFSDVTGPAFFSPADLRPGYNDHVWGKHKDTLKRPEIFHTDTIPAIKLDDFIALYLPGNDPISMKIDVDGAEEVVLQGAIETLKGNRLHAVMLELQRKSAENVLKGFEVLGWHEVRRIDETTNLSAAADPHFGLSRFRDMFYVQLEKS